MSPSSWQSGTTIPERVGIDAAAAGARLPVTVQHSPRSIGGFGRFYLAREAAEARHRYVILSMTIRILARTRIDQYVLGHV